MSNTLIYESYVACLNLFTKLAGSIGTAATKFPTQNPLEDVLEELDRYKLWAGNTGAANTGDNWKISLDYRLQEAEFLKNQLARLLSLVDGTSIPFEDHPSFSGDTPDGSSGDSESDSPWEISDDDSSPTDKDDVSQQLKESTFQPPNSEIAQLIDSIKHVIVSLYKLPVRRAAPVDRVRGSASRDVSLYQHFDVLYVRDKFPQADGRLVERLGKIISRRRQLLNYRITHTERLQPPAPKPIVAVPSQALDQLRPIQAPSANAGGLTSEAPLLMATGPGRSIDEKSGRTKTSILRFDQHMLNTDALYAPSVATSEQSLVSQYTGDNELWIPPRPKDENGQPLTHFECPCCGILKYIPLEPERTWASHVLRDLQPYVCTFEGCDMFDHLFDSRDAWFTHELEVHRVEWSCNTCDTIDARQPRLTFIAKEDFIKHMAESHNLDETTLAHTLQAFSRPAPVIDGVCCLCGRHADKLKSHLGRHLEQLALFALPRLPPGPTTSGSRNVVVENYSGDIPSYQRPSSDSDPELRGDVDAMGEPAQAELPNEVVVPDEETFISGERGMETDIRIVKEKIRTGTIAMDLAQVQDWLSRGAAGAWPLETRAERTCGWLFDHATYQQWAQAGNGGRALWIYGPQGSGKSVLAHYLSEEWAEWAAQDPNHGIMLFFRFQRSASSTLSTLSTPTTFASSLMLQILTSPARRSLSAARACQQLLHLAGQYPQGPQGCPFKTVWAAAESLLRLEEDGPSAFTVIVDALDECCFDGPSLPSTSEFVGLLCGTGCKLAVFTRPEAAIVAAAHRQGGLDIALDEEILVPDVVVFARSRCRQLDLSDADTEQVVNIMRTSSHGSFRWAELSLRHLLAQPPHAVADLPSRIRTLPPTVGEFYERSLADGTRALGAEELECRRRLLLLAFQAQRPLRTAEIADALSMRPSRVDAEVSRICDPLASTHGGFLCLSHPSVREYLEEQSSSSGLLGVSLPEAHGFLAERCLECLLGERYRELPRMRSYLLASYQEDIAVEADAEPPSDSFYDYAATFWDYHLVRIGAAPGERVLRRASGFLASLQFVYWSEVSRRRFGDHLAGVNGVLAALSAWRKSLPANQQKLLPLDRYFEEPYNLAAAAFESEPGGPNPPHLPWLARMSLGDFYVIRTLMTEVAATRGHVLAGLLRCLGPNHPLTLTARSGVAYVCLYSGKMRGANLQYRGIMAEQRRAVGERSKHFLDTVIFMGQSEMYMGDFAAAAKTLAKASADTLTAQGPESWRYLSAKWWYAQAAALAGQVEYALHIFEFVAARRFQLFGRRDSFGLVVLVTIGEAQLLLGCHDQAIASLEEAAAWHWDLYAPDNVARIDTELALAAAYRAAGRGAAAWELAGEVERGAGGREHLRGSRFERYCQLCHLEALLLADAGDADAAIGLLQGAITQAEADQNNRALLWMRLDVATLLRRRGWPGDSDQATANFDHIVSDASGDGDGGFPDERDPPRLLAAAERVLALLRGREHGEARRLLDAEQLEWRRPSDLWLWVGGNFCKDLLTLGEQGREQEHAADGSGGSGEEEHIEAAAEAEEGDTPPATTTPTTIINRISRMQPRSFAPNAWLQTAKQKFAGKF